MQRKLGSVLLTGAMTITGVITMAAVTTSAAAQTANSTVNAGAASTAPASGKPKYDLAVTYDATLSDVVNTSRFAMQGGSLQLHGRVYGNWGAVAELAGAHTSNINSAGVGLDLITLTLGPRYTWSPKNARYGLFGQGLLGAAFGRNSAFPSPSGAATSANSFAVKTGGGLNFNLMPHLALRLFEIDYLRTQLPNSTNNAQNNVTLGAGAVFQLP